MRAEPQARALHEQIAGQHGDAKSACPGADRLRRQAEAAAQDLAQQRREADTQTQPQEADDEAAPHERDREGRAERARHARRLAAWSVRDVDAQHQDCCSETRRGHGEIGHAPAEVCGEPTAQHGDDHEAAGQPEEHLAGDRRLPSLRDGVVDDGERVRLHRARAQAAQRAGGAGEPKRRGERRGHDGEPQPDPARAAPCARSDRRVARGMARAPRTSARTCRAATPHARCSRQSSRPSRPSSGWR